MKKVKTLNEDLIRKLIFETIDEVSLGEGRKKKIEEAEPEENPQDMADLSSRMGYPPENEPDQTVVPGVPNQLSQPDEVIIQALKALKGSDNMARTGAWSILVGLAETILDKDKQIKKALEQRQ